jgi:hypothetical protein
VFDRFGLVFPKHVKVDSKIRKEWMDTLLLSSPADLLLNRGICFGATTKRQHPVAHAMNAERLEPSDRTYTLHPKPFIPPLVQGIAVTVVAFFGRRTQKDFSLISCS